MGRFTAPTSSPVANCLGVGTCVRCAATMERRRKSPSRKTGCDPVLVYQLEGDVSVEVGIGIRNHTIQRFAIPTTAKTESPIGPLPVGLSPFNI